MAGTLYVIATPIGNLKDFSRRGVEAIAACEFLLVEDTRVTIKILNHFDLKKTMHSCHEHNERQRFHLLERAAQAGQNLGLICDAGVPLISDPGAQIVSQAIALEMKIVPIPGASAFLMALVGSGLATDRFVFEGFLPDKQGQMRSRLNELSAEERTIVFYVSPHKLLKTLAQIESVLGDRRACLARELTKLHEEFLRAKISELSNRYASETVRGELVLIVEGRPALPGQIVQRQELEALAEEMLNNGKTVKDVAQALASQFDLRRADVYKVALQVAKRLQE